MSGALPASLNLASLTASQGVVYSTAPGAGGFTGTIAGAGDVNGDGYDDILIGSQRLNGNAGSVSLILGSASGWANLNLSTATPPAAYDFTGPAGSNTGTAMAGAGDVNGDGLADFIIIAPGASAAGRSGNGVVYLVFGKTGGWADTNLTGLNGGASGGYQIFGAVNNGFANAIAAQNLGDINGDGFADIFMTTAVGFINQTTVSGAIVFGKAGGTNNANFTNLDLATATTGQAIRVTGPVPSFSFTPPRIGAAGDINGDGYADFAWGSRATTVNGVGNAGAVFVGFGSATPGPVDFNNAIPAGAGFRINGSASNSSVGTSVASAGDVNGDGITDLLVGSDGGGKAYLIFGRAGPWVDISVDSLTPAVGIAFTAEGGNFGLRVSAAGDLNGDGYGDMLISRSGSVENGFNNAGSVFVVYGKPTGWTNIDFNGTAPDALIQGPGANAALGEFGLAALGDTNGDGFGDIGVGAVTFNANDGRGYALFSQATGTVTFFGTTLADSLHGGAGGDTLSGAAGNDTLSGNAGDDQIDGGTGNDRLSGDAGNDVLFGDIGNDTLLGGAGDDILYGGPGNDSMVGGSGDDKYVVDAADDLVMENAAEGFDAAFVFVAGWTAAINLEAVYLYDSITVQLGSGSADVLVANVSGLASTLDGSGGDDALWGRGGGDTLTGGVGNDVLRGLAGDDVLIGGTGGDQLVGGAGADRFVFDVAAWGYDQIFDFSSADGDKIDMRGSGVTSLAGFTTIQVIGADTAISFNSQRIDVYGAANLQASDFIFA